MLAKEEIYSIINRKVHT